VTGDATLATGLARFFRGPLVRTPLGVRGLAALAGNLTLLVAIHRREPSIFFGHGLPRGK
jgi:hypothetical protein